MSIASRMAVYTLTRNTSIATDAYGIMNDPYTGTTEILVSITKDKPTHDNTNPAYDTTSYLGITKYVGVLVGDILSDGVHSYKVKDIGNRGTVYQPLYLEKSNENND